MDLIAQVAAFFSRARAQSLVSPGRGISRREEIGLGVGAFLVCCLFTAPLWFNDYPWTHEADSYPLRLLGLCHAMAEGRWDGRWVCDFGLGFGSPFFNFYPPGFFYLGALFRPLGLSYAQATKAAVTLISLAGSVGFFLYGRYLWRSACAGVLAALLWTYFPYRIVDLYVRGDFAELSALTMMPWALLGHLWLLRGGGARALVLAAVAHGAVFAYHNISALIFQAFLIGFDLIFLLAEGRESWRRWPRLAASHALALCLGAAWWAPAFFEKKLVHIGKVLEDSSVDARGNLLWFSQFFKTDWDWGSSLPGPDDQMSFQLGWATLAGVAVGLAWGIAIGLRRSRAGWRLAALGLLALPTLGLMLNGSMPFWEHVALARFIQFPWRLLLLASLTLPLLAGPAGYLIEALPRRYRLFILLLVATAVPGLVWAYVQPCGWFRLSDQGLEKKVREEYVTTAVVNEYLPNTVPFFKPVKIGSPFKAGTVVVEEGSGGVVHKDKLINGLYRRYEIKALTPVIIIWTHFFYPGWLVKVDGAPKNVGPSPAGYITFKLPAGTHTVEFSFGNNTLRFGAKFISEVALAVVLFLMLKPWLDRRNVKRGRSLTTR